MKKAALIIVKLLLFVFFLHNIGLFSYIASLEPAKKTYSIKEGGMEEDIQFLNEKINKAKSLGNNYGPEEYFSDLTEIMLKEKNNDFDQRAVIAVNNSKMELNKYFRYSLENKKKTLSKEEHLAYLERLYSSRDFHLEITEPGYREREAELYSKLSDSTYWSNLFLSFFKSLLRIYLKNIWLAVFLLWIWWYEEKNTFKINNPFSFIFCVIFYPIIIIRVWVKIIKEGSRFLAMSIELRRRERNLFSLFSDNEVQEIRRLAKSNLKLSEYRHYLDEKGLIRRHALLPVIAVTCLFILLPPLSSANSQENKFSNLPEDYIEEICSYINSPPKIIEVNFSINEDDFASPCGIILEEIFIFFQSICLGVVILLVPDELLGFKNNSKPIPLFVNNFLPVAMSNNIINQQLRRKNEKNSNHHCFIFLGQYSFRPKGKFGNQRFSGY